MTPDQAIAQLDAEDRESARSALDWLTGGEGLDLLTQRGVLDFLGYGLPRKWLTGVEDHLHVATALGRLLRVLGLPRYATLCEDPQTEAILRTYAEAGDSAGFAAYRQRAERSGVEPPDTDLLTWGSVMGLDEAQVRDEVERSLELALMAGDLVVGGRGWRHEAARITERRLLTTGADGRTLLALVHAERAEQWASSRGPRRAALTAPFQPELVAPPAEADPGLAPLLWLLRQAFDGAPLTATHALVPPLVTAFCETFPDRVSWVGRREVDVHEVGVLRELATELRAMRRTGRTLVLTKSGKDLLAGGTSALWPGVCDALLGGRPAERAASEIELLALLGSDDLTSPEIDQLVLEVLTEQGWGAGPGKPPMTSHQASYLLGRLRRSSRLLGMRPKERGLDLRTGLTELGRAAAVTALTRRAWEPATQPF